MDRKRLACRPFQIGWEADRLAFPFRMSQIPLDIKGLCLFQLKIQTLPRKNK
ncbi:MAG: hypothetical protein PHQ83_06700 [Eubacteriales bacterium]|nr:hypothetical protein [Eubacteriales bacterium]